MFDGIVFQNEEIDEKTERNKTNWKTINESPNLAFL